MSDCEFAGSNATKTTSAQDLLGDCRHTADYDDLEVIESEFDRAPVIFFFSCSF